MQEIIDRVKNANSFDQLRDAMVDFMEAVRKHTHMIRVPNEDPMNPFSNYDETRPMIEE